MIYMIREIKVKTALSPSKLPEIDYALNPYKGCAHACVYCYAPEVIHWKQGKWGEVVEVKINLPRILSRELTKKKRGVVGLGTVTDAYQPVEKKYEITRRCLEVLQLHDIPVCIQTKSSLVLRDVDILRRFSNIEVGLTLTVLDDRLRERIEPGASSVEERLHTLKELKKMGISTWVFLGPVLPHITETDALIDAIISTNPKYVLIDRLRLRKGVWKRIKDFLGRFYPQLLPEYEHIFEVRYHYEEILEKMRLRCEMKGVRCEINEITSTENNIMVH